MFIGSMVGWWYGRGWALQFDKVWSLLARVSRFFSAGLLLRTLFSPFRQIGNDRLLGSAPLNAQLMVWLDKLVSRGIGAAMRVLLLVLCGVILLACFAVGVVWLLVWPFIPVMPFIGAIMSIKGVL